MKINSRSFFLYFATLILILSLHIGVLNAKNSTFQIERITPHSNSDTYDLSKEYGYFDRHLGDVDDMFHIQKLSFTEQSSKKDNEYLLSNCLYTTNQEFSELTTNELVDYLKSTPNYECIARILFSYDALYSPVIFTNDKIQAVANQLSALAPWYDGTNANGIYSLILYLRVATYFDFYYNPDIVLNQDSWDAIKLATSNLAVNNHIFDLNADAANILEEFIVLLDLPGIRSSPNSLYVVKEIMYRMAVTKNWKTVDDIDWVKGYWNIFFLMFRGSQDAAYLDSIAQDEDFIELWGLVATDSEIKAEPQIKDLYQSNAILEMSRLAVKPEFSDLLCPHLADVCLLYDRLETNWLYAIIAINQAGKCQDYNLCEDVDELNLELIEYLFPNKTTYDNNKLVFNSKLSRNSSDLLYYATKQSQAQFFRLLQSDQPVPGDTNNTIYCYVFASKNDYDSYAPYLFGISTNNGGMYIESRSEFYTWDRPSSYYLSLEELFRHEYVHYLQGRYLIPGMWGQAPIYNNDRLTWYEEGNAELISASTLDRGLKLKASSYDRLKNEYPNCPTIDDILHSSYSQSSQIYYPYGHLLWYHWYYEDFQILRKFMDYTISNDVQGFDSLVDSILADSNFETRWRAFLQRVNNDDYEVWDINTAWINDDSITTRNFTIIKDEFEASTGLSDYQISNVADSLISRFKLVGTFNSDRQVQTYSEAFQALNISMDSILTLMISNSQINNFVNTIGYFTNVNIVNGYPEAIYNFVGSLRNINVPEMYSVDFVADKNVALDSSTIQFTSLSDGYIKHYLWEFEGGIPSNSIEKNPSIQYFESGVYKVSLKITGSQPDDTLSAIKEQFVRIYEKPYIDEYCSATHGYDYAWISLVRINDLVNQSSGFPPLGYSDFSHDNISEIFRDSNNLLQVNVSYTNSPNFQVAVWIDLNQDGDFNELDEKVFTSFIPQSQQLGLVSFQLPDSSLTGATKLRVRLIYRGTQIMPCGYDSYMGEVEDYSVFIRDKGSLNYSEFDINITQGWQMISSHTDPFSKSMRKLWNDIEGVVLVKNGSGQTYIPMYDINQIGNWRFCEAYQVYANQNSVITIKGMSTNPELTPIELEQGWRMVSYLRTSPLSIPLALESLTANDALVIAKQSSGEVYIPMYGINQIGDMIPGRGYQMYLSNNASLIYPANSQNKLASLGDITPVPKVFIPYTKSTGSSATLLIFSETEDGNEIGVYGDNNLLVGAGAFHNGIATVTLWGDDDRTPIKDGALINESLRFSYYNLNSGKVSNLELFDLYDIISQTELHEIVFKNDAFFSAQSKIESDIGSNVDSDGYQINSYSLSPNPFQNDIKINFYLVENADVNIKVYSMSGALINTIFDGTIQSGNKIITYDGSKLANGEYLIMLTIGKDSYIRKLIRSN